MTYPLDYMTSNSFQDSGTVEHCHGCGPNNPQGLQLKSFWDGEASVATWTPKQHHCAGSRTILNGGIICSLIDCHSVNLAIATAYKEAGRQIGTGDKIYCVTANIKVDFLKPTPIDGPVTLRATIIKKEGRKSWIDCEVSSNNTVTARGEVLAIQLKENKEVSL